MRNIISAAISVLLLSVPLAWPASPGPGTVATSCVIRCPADLNVQCATEIPPRPRDFEEFLAAGGSVTGDCSASYSSSDGPLVRGPSGATLIRTHNLLDNSGASVNCTQTFTIEDTTFPVIESCPASRSIEAGINCRGTVPDLTTPEELVVVDNCTAYDDLVISQFPSAGETFPNGAVILVTIMVIDTAGNVNACATVVTVGDDTSPEYQKLPRRPNSRRRGCL